MVKVFPQVGLIHSKLFLLFFQVFHNLRCFFMVFNFWVLAGANATFPNFLSVLCFVWINLSFCVWNFWILLLVFGIWFRVPPILGFFSKKLYKEWQKVLLIFTMTKICNKFFRSPVEAHGWEEPIHWISKKNKEFWKCVGNPYIFLSLLKARKWTKEFFLLLSHTEWIFLEFLRKANKKLTFI